MIDPIELIVAENKAHFSALDGERSQTVRDYLDMVLSYAYGRTTNQHKSSDQLAMKMDGLNEGADTAARILSQSGYVNIQTDAIYATDKGIKFMENNYSGQELWGINIK